MKGRAYIATRRAHILGERLVWQILGGRREWEDVRTYQKTGPLRTWEKELDEEEKTGSNDEPFHAGQ